MGSSRASHNYRRRVKLIEKQTGKTYNPHEKKKYGGGKNGHDKQWWSSAKEKRQQKQAARRQGSGGAPPQESGGEDTQRSRWWGGARGRLADKKQKKLASQGSGGKQKTSGPDRPETEAPKKKKLKRPVDGDKGPAPPVEGATPEVKKKKKKPTRPVDGDKGPAPPVEGAAPEVKRKKKKRRVTTEATPNGSAVEPELKKRKKVRSSKTDATLEHSQKKQRAQERPADADCKSDEAKPKKMSKKEIRKLKLEARLKRRRTATVICPGSLSDRYARSGPLNGNEMRLLKSGSLSWRWLREPRRGDEEMLPENRRTRPNQWEHQDELQAIHDKLPSKLAADKLKHFDSVLSLDAHFPACGSRAKLAQRLQSKKGLQRRCERYFEEVVSPLLNEPSAASSASQKTNREASGESAGGAVLREARNLCIRLVQQYQTTDSSRSATSQDIDAKQMRWAWLQMLRKALASQSAEAEDKSEAAEGRFAWLRALRGASCARLCPKPDSENQKHMLEAVASAARAAQLGTSDGSALVMIPLGVFTCWQALLLVAIACSLGSSATVVRRSANGTPQVIFRTTDLHL